MATRVISSKPQCDELKGLLPIQVGQDLFTMHVVGKNKDWKQFVELGKPGMRSIKRSDLLNARKVATLVNFANEQVFVSGGQDP